MDKSIPLWQHETFRITSSSWMRKVTRVRYTGQNLEQLEKEPFRESFWARRVFIRRDLHFPIERFMARHVGQDYNAAFSALVQRIPQRLRHGHPCNSWVVEEWALPKTYAADNPQHHLMNCNGVCYYVDLDTNTLCADEANLFYQPFEKTFFEIDFLKQSFVFEQLRTTQAFKAEGSALSHCVASYRKLCRQKIQKTSIWSLSVRVQPLKTEKILTIQVSATQIVQVRGYKNRFATKEERRLIQTWAKRLQLECSAKAFGKKIVEEGD
jgi:PcfJ-like protein